MKKINVTLLIVLAISLAMVSLVGCQKKAEDVTATPAPEVKAETTVVKATTTAPAYEDGIYFAMDDEFASNGWKYTATITVENGKIVDANWEGVNVAAGAAKKAFDAAGKYGMMAFGGAQADWKDQAKLAEDYLVEIQDPSKITYKDDKGHTDDIAGVSVHVVELFSLAEKALAAGPVGRGAYADGAYYYFDEDFGGSGWKEYVALTVVNGYIASANWSAVDRAGNDKKAYDAAGKYGMMAYGDAQADWSDQAKLAEDYLIEKQDPSMIEYKDEDGHTDAIAGVSIHVNGLFDLAQEALAAGPQEIGPYTDGGYYASQDDFGETGWKEYVSVFVENGKIASVNWSALNENGDDKKVYDAEGKYNMVAYGNAQDEWSVQAARVEQYLIDSQDPTAITYIDEEGHTDAISGVSVHVSSCYELVEQALANGPISYDE